MSWSRAVAKALSHPARVEVLRSLRKGPTSPSDVAATTSASVGVLTYHMRELESAGLIELVRTEPVRGAVEHFYEVTPLGREVTRAVDAVLRLDPGRPAGRGRSRGGQSGRAR